MATAVQQPQQRRQSRRQQQRRRRAASAGLLAAAALALLLAAPGGALGESQRAGPPPPAALPAGGDPRSLGGVTAARPALVLLGDSITEFGGQDGGWAALLGRDYVRKADVINRGYSGYNSRWGAYVVEEAAGAFAGRARLATIFFGANDASPPDRAHGFLAVPVDEYAANLKAIAARFRAAGVAPLIIAPPPVNDEDGHFADGARSNARAGEYAAAAVAAAREIGAPVVDLWTRVQEVPDWRNTIMHADGLHMSDAGNRFIHAAVMQAIAEAAPELAPAALPLHFPGYDRVDVARPALTFDAVYGRHVEPAGGGSGAGVGDGVPGAAQG